MSLWKRAQIDPYTIVKAPIRNTVSIIKRLIVSVTRIRRNTLAITMVEEWSKEETGVGLSMALGSQGWNRNWADFAIILIKSLTEMIMLYTPKSNSCCPLRIKITKIAMYSLKSLTRLYMTAWRAEVLASLRLGHQEIKRKDKILTLSHLRSINIRFVQEVRQNIKVMNNTIKKINFFSPASSLMYLILKRRIDQRTRYLNIKKETL